MKIGYARTSTLKQEAGLAAQLRQLLAAEGCEEVFQEQVSSVGERAQLEAALRMLRAGDVLVVTKLDRFARSLEHAICLERRIAAKGASLKVLDPAIDTSTPIGRLLFGMLGSVAQFEREINDALRGDARRPRAVRAAGSHDARRQGVAAGAVSPLARDDAKTDRDAARAEHNETQPEEAFSERELRLLAPDFEE